MKLKPGSPRAWRAQARVRMVPPDSVHARDGGVRLEAARAFELDETMRAPDALSLFRRSAWLWFQRDPVTGELPFGVW